MECGEPDVVNNSIREVSGPEGRVFLFDHMVAYTCLSGYEFIAGNLFRICQSDGNYTGLPPQCEGNGCCAGCRSDVESHQSTMVSLLEQSKCE